MHPSFQESISRDQGRNAYLEKRKPRFDTFPRRP